MSRPALWWEGESAFGFLTATLHENADRPELRRCPIVLGEGGATLYLPPDYKTRTVPSSRRWWQWWKPAMVVERYDEQKFPHGHITIGHICYWAGERVINEEIISPIVNIAAIDSFTLSVKPAQIKLFGGTVTWREPE